MIALGTVGTSNITDKFLSGVALTGRFKYTAVYSRNAKTGNAFAAKHGVKQVFTDLTEMAKSGIEAVYIASPNVFHAAQSRIFLENGVHVICEKPITVSLSEYEELKALADKNNLIYMEAIIPRHTAGYAAVKQALAEIGDIAVAKIDFCQRSSRFDAFLRGEKPNIFDMSLHAGTLMDLGIYCVYGAVDLLGEPCSVDADAVLLSNGADGAGTAVLKYESFPAVLTYCKTGQSVTGSEIVGKDGTLKIGMISQYSDVTLVKNGQERRIVDFPDKAVLMSGEAAKFAEYIENVQSRSDYMAVSELCRKVHRCMDKIKRSAGLKYPALQK